jgi:hypothetical protein
MVIIRARAVLFMLLCAVPAQAASIPAPIEIEIDIGNARLAGQGSFRWFGFKIYDAQLWVGDRGYLPNAPESAKFALSLTYARNLYGKHIARTSIDEIGKLGYGTSEQHQGWLSRMEALFPDVHAGTQISGIYLPDHGARFYLNGNLLGEIADKEFARAFFSIWLDPRTSATSLRSSLLSSAQ